jgi:hypothetical protein
MPQEFVPVERGAESLMTFPDLAPLPGSGTDDGKRTPSSYPRSLAELPYTGTLSQLMDVRLAVQMGLPIAGFEGEASRRVFVQQFQRYAWVQESGQRAMYGVGVRWLVDIRQVDAKFQISASLPMLTAAAQLGYINATVRFDAIGMISREIDASIPAPTVLSVETHAEYAAALKHITTLMWNDGTIILPQPLSMPLDRAGVSGASIAEVWVLNQVAVGASLRATLTAIAEPTDDIRERVRDLYRRFAANRAEDQVPTEAQVEHAKALLKHFPLGKPR